MSGKPLVRRDDDLDSWATRIAAALQKTVDSIFETGRQLLAAREALDHGQWTRLFEDHRVPMTLRTANRFIEIHKRRELLTANGTHGSRLPPSWRTLHELARLPEDTLAWAHAQDKITPDLERRDVARLRAEYDDRTAPPRSPADPFAEEVIEEVAPAKKLPASIAIPPGSFGVFADDHLWRHVQAALKPAYDLIEIWPDEKSLDLLIHEVRNLLKFLDRLEAQHEVST